MQAVQHGHPRARSLGIQVGILPPGPLNAITDLDGVRVGQQTIWQGDEIRTGVTAIIPHPDNLFQEKVPAAIAVGNGFGKLAGSTQVEELGTLESPIVLTNTLAVPMALQALIRYTLIQEGNGSVRSFNGIVGETNDGWLNDIRALAIGVEDVLAALETATAGQVAEGSVGAGTGTICFGFKGGMGTSSRQLPGQLGGYSVGVLVQTNYGGILTVNGAPVGRELGRYYLQHHREMNERKQNEEDGSCMVVVATDAPLCARNLKRLARRALLGLSRTGSALHNGSGDYVIGFSTAYRLAQGEKHLHPPVALLSNSGMDPLFTAVVEATEEAVYNSLFAATSVTGRDGHRAEALPLDEVVAICRRYNVIDLQKRLSGR